SMTYHRTASVERLQILLLIATLALMVLWIIGMAVTLLEKHYQFQANSVRHKKVLSIIFIGLQMVNQTRIRLSRDDIPAA
ncbi:MAG: IS4 family transposase, partial [Gammaproteobacteria bacterium]|nr:IS4 family transposase [Gammaproteobacteria bacterium]